MFLNLHGFSNNLVSLLLMACVLSACGGGSGGDNANINDGNKMQLDEVAKRLSVAAATQLIPAGDQDCPNGGILIETGIDENGNGILDVPDEVDDTHKICNGTDGKDGTDGSPGAPGINALVSVERVTDSSSCPAGGLRIDVGMDLDSDGTLSTNEIQDSSYVCDGEGVIRTVWKGPEPLEYNLNGQDSRPVLAMNSAGKAVAVWSHASNNGNALVANYYDKTVGGWGEPVNVSDFGGYNYNVEILENGEAWVVWSQGGSVWARMYSPETKTWQEAKNLGIGDNSVLSINRSGTILVLRAELDNMNTNIRESRYTNESQSWTDRFIYGFQAFGGGFHLAQDDSGNAIFVWEQSTTTSHADIWGMYYDAETDTWRSPELLDQADASAVSPRIAMDGSGNGIVVWEQRGSEGSHIWAKSFDATSKMWGTPFLIEDHTSIDEAALPRVVLTKNGHTFVLWEQGSGMSGYQIWSSIYHEHSDTWDVPTRLDEHEKGSAFFGSMDVNDFGEAILVWHHFDGLRTNLWSRRWILDVGWQEAEPVEQVDNDASSVTVGIDNDGNTMAVWEWRGHENAFSGQPITHIVASTQMSP